MPAGLELRVADGPGPELGVFVIPRYTGAPWSTHQLRKLQGAQSSTVLSTVSQTCLFHGQAARNGRDPGSNAARDGRSQ